MIAADGKTYEKAAIVDWFINSNISPLTNVPLPHKHIQPDYEKKTHLDNLLVQRAEAVGRWLVCDFLHMS